MKKKILVSVVATSLLIGSVIGGTLAYLTDTTQQVTNTFTVGQVDISLTETEGDITTDNGKVIASSFKMIPGNSIAKDPTVTVEAGSEASWLFVEITKSTNFDTFMEYTMAEGWTQFTDANGDPVEGLYYREVSDLTVANATDEVYHVIAGDNVTVKVGVTTEQMDALTDATYPTLTFKAYAVQKDNVATPQAAWAAIQNPSAS